MKDDVEAPARPAEAMLPRASVAAPPARGSSAKERSGSEAEPEDAKGHGAADCLGLILCLVIFFGIGGSILYYGPKRLLRKLLLLVPRKPGWDWYIGLGVFTTLSIVFLMPIWPPMCMASGLLFGIFDGMILNICSIWSAAAISVILGRYFLRDAIRTSIYEGNYPKVRRMILVLEDEDNSLKFQVLFRFLFIPMFIRNYGPSTLEIPLWKLLVGSIPHSIWISFLFASLGATFKDTAALIRDGKEVDFHSMKWQQGVIFLAAILIAVVLAVYAHRKYTERMAQDEEQESLAATPRGWSPMEHDFGTPIYGKDESPGPRPRSPRTYNATGA